MDSNQKLNESSDSYLNSSIEEEENMKCSISCESSVLEFTNEYGSSDSEDSEVGELENDIILFLKKKGIAFFISNFSLKNDIGLSSKK